MIISGTAAAAPSGYRWQAGAGLFISSGDYGTDTETTTTYIPFSFGRLFSRGKVDLVIPFITVTSADNVSVVGGKVQRINRRTGGEKTSEGGLGDMLLRGRLQVLDENDGLQPDTTLTAKIKIPTASESKGLGTGEFDESIGVEFWKTIQGPWSALLDLGYTFTGNPPGQELRNPWQLAFGGGYAFRSNLIATASYEESRALVPGSDNPRDLVFGVSFVPKPTVQISGNLQFGLSDGSPDIGVGGFASFKFK
jgi:hypothetical protein